MVERSDGRRLPRPAAWLAATALLVVVCLEASLWAVTRVFVLNVSTAGPNATAGLVVLLVTGWTAVVVTRAAPGDARPYLVAAGGLPVGFVGSLVDAALLAGLGAAATLTAATVLLVAAPGELRERPAVGVAVGLLLWPGLRVALGTLSPYATTLGRALFGAVVLAVAVLVAELALSDAVPPTGRLGSAPAPLGALLVVAAAYLASPSAVARWAPRPYGVTVLALVAGIAAGLVLAHARAPPTGAELAAWAGTFLVAVGAVLCGSGPPSTAAVAVAWAAAVVLLAAGSRPGADATGTGAAPLVAVQVLALLALFGHVAARNWAFIPPLDATRGLAAEFLLALHAVFPLSVLLSAHDRGAAPVGTPAGSRRSLLGSLAAGAVPPVSLLARDHDPAPAPDAGGEEPLRAMAYNLHLFFEEGGGGRYNLEALRSVIEDSGADVVAVCESNGSRVLSGNVDGLRWLARRLDCHAEFGAPTRAGGYGVGLLSRWPLDDVSVVELPVGRSPTRSAVAATVRAPTGPVPVVAAHFMTEKPGDVRYEQAETAIDLATDRDRAVVLGDFNVEPDPEEPADRTLDAALTDARTAAESGGAVPGRSARPTPGAG